VSVEGGEGSGDGMLVPTSHPSEHPNDQPTTLEPQTPGADVPSASTVGASEAPNPGAIAHAEELVALATAQMGPYTTFQQLSFSPRFPLASISDDYIIPPTYPDFCLHRVPDNTENDAHIEPTTPTPTQPLTPQTVAPVTGPVQFTPPGLPVPSPSAPSKWYYRDPKNVVHGKWMCFPCH
jgi:hypothetical protein